MDKTKNKLEPGGCPHCKDGWADVQQYSTGPGPFSALTWHAAACQCCGYTAASALTEQGAIENWNSAALAGAQEAQQECGNCFDGKSDMDHDCRKCGGTGVLAGAPVAQAEQSACRWTYNDDEGIWHTACGQAWMYEAGGTPAEHGAHYCHHCGKTLEAVRGEPGAAEAEGEPADTDSNA